MKLSTALVLGLTASTATAFAPAARSPAAVRPVVAVTAQPSALFMSEEAAAEEEAPAAPAASTGGKLVPIKEETVEFTAGLIGGLVGLSLGGPALAAVAAAAANYASKTDAEVGDVVSAVSKTAIEIYNYLAKLDDKYSVLAKAKSSLEEALAKVKSQGNVDPDTVAKLETALDSTNQKISEINEEYDLVGAGSTALGVVGDLVEKAVAKASELEKEYSLTAKAKEALAKAVDKAKSASS
mmetsp:Transcript_34140/g.100536  ORF Transcript_34140/g.100536 Transcript_34140/m.100536 type:complete len:240 (-) Transcript_34140:420-1139(-)